MFLTPSFHFRVLEIDLESLLGRGFSYMLQNPDSGESQMLDGNDLRAEFARYLTEHTHTRWGLDAALMHVCKIAYSQGLQDGRASAPAIQRSQVQEPYSKGS